MEQKRLSDHPKIAKEIGLLIMGMANLDIYLLPALTRLLRGKLDLATAILAPVDNITAKKDIVFAVAERRKHIDPFAAKLLDHKAPIDKAIAFRNLIAHGHFGHSGKTGKLCVISNAVSQRRGKQKHTALSAKAIAAHSSALDDAFMLIKVSVGNVLVRDPPPPASPGKRAQASPKSKTPRKARPSQPHRSQPSPSRG